MDDEVQIESERQFWDELDDIVCTPCRSHDRIDDTLRTWLSLTSRYRDEYLQDERDAARCSLKLLQSPLFSAHGDYVRHQLLYCLLQDDDSFNIHLATSFLLLDGRRDEQSFEWIGAEGAFPRLVQLIRDEVDDGLGLHRQLLELLYEMCRIRKMSTADLAAIDDNFMLYLLRIIEGHSDDASDPYHYSIIRVLLVLNEQYMLAAHSPVDSKGMVTNRVIKVLAGHGSAYKTFGENIILLLNREDETSLQLLILKLLYLMFTTDLTREYFYTNDLHVLVDILIRNILDLPPDPIAVPATPDSPTPTLRPSSTSSLRHTYLRVLYPLLAHTQLKYPPHYKRDVLRRTLFILADAGQHHFDRPDETTTRLVDRCMSVEWIRDTDDEDQQGSIETPTSQRDDDGWRLRNRQSQGLVAKKALGMQLPEAQMSTLSVAEVAAQREKPGVLTPSRERGYGPFISEAPTDDLHENGGSEPPENVPSLQRSPFDSDDE